MAENKIDSSSSTTENYSEWDTLSGLSTEQNEVSETSTEFGRSEALRKSLGELEAFLDNNEGILSTDAQKAIIDAYRKIEAQMEKVELDECEEFLPDSRRTAFRNYVEKHLFSRSDLIDAIKMRVAGKNDAEILDYIVSLDHNGANEEFNRKRGEEVFNDIISVIGEQGQE